MDKTRIKKHEHPPLDLPIRFYLRCASNGGFSGLQMEIIRNRQCLIPSNVGKQNHYQMKIYYLIFSLLLFIPIFTSAVEFERDTIGYKKSGPSISEPKSKKKTNSYIDLYTGIFQNKTFGTHPIFGARWGVRFNRNSGYYLASEFRFLDSKNKYDVVVEDSLITTDYFFGEYLGLEYERLIFSKKSHEFISITSLGYDWIRLPEVNDKTQRKGGFAFNIGFGYLFKIKNGAGPNIKFLYHYAKIDNKNGSNLNNNSIIIRITYDLGYIE